MTPTDVTRAHRATKARLLLRLGVGAAFAATTSIVSTATVAADWPTYHQNQARTGADPSVTALGAASHIWSNNLDGALFAEPVTIGNIVIAATENDSVYAFDILSGGQLWVKHVANPLTNVHGVTGCGDIDPLGITGTPAIDVGTRTVYVVAEEPASAGAQHELFGLNVDSGSTVFREVIDGAMTPQGTAPNDQREQQQRGALGVSGGRVYVPFGGLAGDCGNYHGWVVGVDESGGALHSYEVAPNANGGGIWAPSGMSFDGVGNLFVSTGNSSTTSSTAPTDDSESVIKLNPDLTKIDRFTTSSWRTDNANDTDLGSTGPAQLAGGLVFAVGKNGNAYLLSGGALGGTGGELRSHPLCDAFGGTAYDGGSNLYVPCTNGVTQVHIDVQNHDFSQGWKQGAASKPPIIAGGLVWSISGSTLDGMDPGTGNIVTQLGLSASGHSFVTPTAAQGHLFAAAGTFLDAFTTPPGTMAVKGTDNTLYAHHPGTSWFTLGGALDGAPAVVPIPSLGSIVDFYIVVGSDHTLWARTDAVGWKPLSPSPTSCLDNPAATIDGSLLVVACQGADHTIWAGSTTVDPNAFPSIPGFQPRGGVTMFGPALATVNGTITYYVVGTDSGIYLRTDANGWFRIGASSCKGHPAAGAAGSTSYIACHGSDDALWYATNSFSFVSAGGTLIDGPGLAAFSSEVAFTVEGVNGEVWQNVVTPTSSTGWIDQVGVAQNGAAAANV